ncbi:putative phytanoyl- dioxygenase family protein [Diplodia seriata]|uniref:Putative phytanoyl-dioxygenase family protein n=1 Tax=Diplodia seriata TaxID=420778 RepID=A0A0G2E2Y2_9PEZI|nr:putative phytanoyl- dioxygenase family protein [Diplodia seriata]
MPSAVPVVQRIDASEPEAIIEALKKDGGVIIKNFTTPELVDQVNAETEPYLRKDKPWKGALFPPETRRCTRLVTRSPTVRNHWLMHPLVSRLTTHFLSKTTPCWYNDDRHEYTVYPILSTSVTMECNPGGAGQRLHRDEKVHHATRDDQTESGYRMGSDVMMAFLVPGTQTTPENGATVENQYLIHTKEDVASWPLEMRRLMGYDISSPNLGFVDFITPHKWITGDYNPDAIDDLDPIKT